MNIYVDAKMADDHRRAAVYEGKVFVHNPSENALELCRLAQELIENAFTPLDPLRVHENISRNPGGAKTEIHSPFPVQRVYSRHVGRNWLRS